MLSIINAYKLRFDDQALLIYMASLIGHLDSLIVECGLMKSLNKKKIPRFPFAILPTCQSGEYNTNTVPEPTHFAKQPRVLYLDNKLYRYIVDMISSR